MGVVAGKARTFIEIGPGRGPIVARPPRRRLMGSSVWSQQMKARIAITCARPLGVSLHDHVRSAWTFGIEVR